MIAISIQSGSNGNCIYVEAEGVRLLFDAGLSGRRAEQRLGSRGRDIRLVHALIVSHEHADHVRCAGVFHRKFRLPLYITRRTLHAAKDRMGTLRDVCYFKAGARLRFGKVSVQTLPTPHDGADAVAFVVSCGGKRLGILTDLGHVFGALRKTVSSLDAVFIESNYDPEMLAHGPYWRSLKERIRGPGGHLSNLEAACLLRDCARDRLQWACLAHLSEVNNDPELALATHRRILGRRFSLHVAGRYGPSDLLKV